MMTRKEFDKLAYVLAMSEPLEDNFEARVTWLTLREDIVRVCKQSNSRFNTDHFINATDFEYWRARRRPL